MDVNSLMDALQCSVKEDTRNSYDSQKILIANFGYLELRRSSYKL